MFINTGGLPEQHRHHRGQLHLQLQHHHHHGHRHLQQFGQLHLPHRSRRLAARRCLLLPDSHHCGRLSAAALLLKPLGPPRPPPDPSSPFIPPSSHPLQPLSSLRDHETNNGWTPQPPSSSLK